MRIQPLLRRIWQSVKSALIRFRHSRWWHIVQFLYENADLLMDILSWIYDSIMK